MVKMMVAADPQPGMSREESVRRRLERHALPGKKSIITAPGRIVSIITRTPFSRR